METLIKPKIRKFRTKNVSLTPFSPTWVKMCNQLQRPSNNTCDSDVFRDSKDTINKQKSIYRRRRIFMPFIRTLKVLYLLMPSPIAVMRGQRVIRTNVNTGLIAQVGESYRHTTRYILTNARESVKYSDWFERTHSNQEKSRETIHSINIHQSKLPIRRQTSRVGSDFNTLHKLESLQIIAPCTFWVLSWFFIRCQPHNGDKCWPCISLPSSAIRQPWSENPQWHLTPDPPPQLLQSAKIATRADVVRH